MTRYHKTPDGNVPFTAEEEIARDAEEQAWAEEQVELAKTKYQRDRQPEYPSISDQLDMLWHAMDTGILPKVDSFYSINKSVKEKYPKE